MEALGLLEKKIKNLVELIEKLKQENALLKTENTRLAEEKVQLSQTVKDAVVEHNKDLDKLSQEKALTKMVVDDLIKNIDSLVEENQP